LALLFMAVIAASAAEPLRAQEFGSETGGVYSVVQAERGEVTFLQECAGCHMPTEFTGSYLEKWAEGSAATLFNQIRRTMPLDNPSSLGRQSYADILAYLLRLNGYVAGAHELEGSDELLRAIPIEVSGGKVQRPGS